MNFTRTGFLLILILTGFSVRSQDFRLNNNQDKFSVSFSHVGNLIIVPLQINNSVPLNFVIDTGSPYTIITNLDAIHYFKLNKGRKISISGLGQNSEQLEAYMSNDNRIQLGNAVSNSTDIVLLFEENFDLSTRFGVPIYGIIGFDILKDFVVEVSYTQQRVVFYKPEYFYKKKQRKLRKFEELPITIENGKPYLTLDSETDGIHSKLKLLVDSGSWDAVWLFENKEENIQIPKNYIEDYLGFGLNGEIHGKKSRIGILEIGSGQIKNPTASFPDSVSVANIKNKGRNGTLGSEILRRFTTIYDYKNKKIYVKKNRYFNEDFHYNLAGLELYQPYPELPYLEVMYVRKNSPAANAGLKIGDAIRYVNGKKIGVFRSDVFDENKFAATKVDIIEVASKKREKISLPELLELFKTKVGEKIYIIYTRGNSDIEHETSFVLEKSI
jgi:hypothetical protein